jgi:L-asparagine transporter-like permease
MGPKHMGPAPYYGGIRTSQEDTSPFRHGRRRKWPRDDSFATVVIWPVALILVCTCVFLELGTFVFLLGWEGYLIVTGIMMVVVALVGVKKWRKEPGKSFIRTVILPVFLVVVVAAVLLGMWLLPFFMETEGILYILGTVLFFVTVIRMTKWHKLKKKSRLQHVETGGSNPEEQKTNV